MDAEVRQAVWQRCEGYCEFCGKPLDAEAWDFHHRQLVTKLDLVVNGIVAQHFCHLGGIHAHPQAAKAKGFIVSKFTNESDFANVPVLLFGGLNRRSGRWVLLTPDGTYGQVE